MRQKVRFAFTDAGAKEDIEADVALAIFTAECVYGRPRVRMEASYLVDDAGKSCVIDVRGEAGEAAARVFTGLTTARIGEQAFQVKRLDE